MSFGKIGNINSQFLNKNMLRCKFTRFFHFIFTSGYLANKIIKIWDNHRGQKKNCTKSTKSKLVFILHVQNSLKKILLLHKISFRKNDWSKNINFVHVTQKK